MDAVATTQLPAGSYEAKVAHGLSWVENYGAGGAPNGANIPFTVSGRRPRVTFSYVLATHVLTITTSRPGPVPDLARPEAHWLRRGLVAWDLPRRRSDGGSGCTPHPPAAWSWTTRR